MGTSVTHEAAAPSQEGTRRRARMNSKSYIALAGLTFGLHYSGHALSRQPCESILNKDQRLACFARAGIPVVDCATASDPEETALCRQLPAPNISGAKVSKTSSPQNFDANEVTKLLKEMPDEPDAKNSRGQWIEVINATLVIFFVVCIYFFPTSIAVRRGHHNKRAIFALNVLLGWTFLGWVVAMVWAWTTPSA